VAVTTSVRRADAPIRTLDLERVEPADAGRFARFVNTDGCHVWTGARSSSGYGVFKVNGTALLAHRVAYVIANGPIPDGLVIDHTCGNRRCVRPSHLEAVSSGENTRRARAAKVAPDAGARLQRALRWLSAEGAHYEPAVRLEELTRRFPDLDLEERVRLAGLSFADAQRESCHAP
jgi:hypothetical protein